MFSLEGVGPEVAQFVQSCERLLSARHTKFSETEKDLISYYFREIMTHIHSLRDDTNR